MNSNRHFTTLATHFLGWQGRVSRSEWWLCWGADLILALVFFLAFESSAYNATGFTLPQMAASTFLFWAASCANIKRFHDRNKEWFWALLTFIPIIGPAWIVVELGFLKGTRGRNAFGADPLQSLPIALPPLSAQIHEARAEFLRLLKTVRPAVPKPAKPASPHVLREPLIQYGCKRPERTITRG